SRSTQLLKDILDTMIHSELFSKVPQDNTSHFWSVYNQVAKEHDQDFIGRHNSDLDSLLIFVG
ncbi:hypothetical protein M422DRAFT_95996, partial [Sphaerobolus stellatus SS14]